MAATEEESTRVSISENENDCEKDDFGSSEKSETFVIGVAVGNQTNTTNTLQDAFLNYKRLRQVS